MAPTRNTELADAEWLDDVVVSAELEANHAVNLVALGRQHHHRGLADTELAATNTPAHFGSGKIGQH